MSVCVSLRPVVASLYQSLAARDSTTKCKSQPTGAGRREGHLKKKCVPGEGNPIPPPTPTWGSGAEANLGKPERAPH